MYSRIIVLSIFVISFLFSCKKENTTNPNIPITYDPPTVTIGTQVWMLRNLNVDHYRNGDPIREITVPLEWANIIELGAWCYYNNDSVNDSIYGKLYNWQAVNDSRGIAPKGWHIPSDEEWTVLVNYLGGDSVAGGKLKKVGTTYWLSPNIGATNESGFSALPCGWRTAYGDFDGIGFYCGWWSSTVFDITSPWYSKTAWSRFLGYRGANLTRRNDYRLGYGFSVRCVKD